MLILQKKALCPSACHLQLVFHKIVLSQQRSVTWSQETQTKIFNRTNYLKEKALRSLERWGQGEGMQTVSLANLVNGQVQEVADKSSQNL